MKTYKVIVTLMECDGNVETPIAETETEPTKNYAEAVETFEVAADSDIDDCLLDDAEGDGDDADVIDAEVIESEG